MSEDITQRVTALCNNANMAPGIDAAIGFLITAIEALADEVKELKEHQHNYFGPPPGLPHRLYTTQPQREIANPSEKVFEAQAAAKLADKKKGKP